MDIFLFEYVTCGGPVPEEIVVEGLGMFESLYSGFSKFAKVNSFIKPEFQESLSLDLPSFQEEDFMESFTHFSEKSEYSLVVAPEDDGLLLELTRLIDRSGSENLGSKAKGVKIASNKWKTYQFLKNKVNMPETSKKPLNPPFLIKPERSCGGEGISVVDSDEYVEEIPKGFIAQEIIHGSNLSVSLIVGDEIKVLSINGQLIENFRYKGAEVPFKFLTMEDKSTGVLEITEIVEQVKELAVKAVEIIPGLHGYVGVDIICPPSGEPYVIEVNARLTTPSIIFDRVYGINLSELIYRNHMGDRIPDLKPERFLILKKASSDLKPDPFSVIGRYGNNMLVFEENPKFK